MCDDLLERSRCPHFQGQAAGFLPIFGGKTSLQCLIKTEANAWGAKPRVSIDTYKVGLHCGLLLIVSFVVVAVLWRFKVPAFCRLFKKPSHFQKAGSFSKSRVISKKPSHPKKREKSAGKSESRFNVRASAFRGPSRER